MGLTDILRTRADGTGTEGEIQQLRELVAELRKEQDKANQEISKLRDEMGKAKAEAEAANQKIRMIKQDLKDSMKKNDELKSRLKEERRKREEVIDSNQSRVPIEAEPMEVEVIPPPRAKPRASAAPPEEVRATEEELRNFPAIRPPILGRRMVIQDKGRDLPPLEIPEDPLDRRISMKKKKGPGGPSSRDMEVFSSVQTEEGDASGTTLEDRVAAKVIASLEKLAGRHMGGEMPPAPPTAAKRVRTPDAKISGAPPAARGNNIPPTPKKKKVSEAKKARKKEKRRLKRQEEARRRAGAPLSHHTGGGGGDTRPNTTMAPGPASRTRAGTRSTAGAADGVPKVPSIPAPRGVRIEDVPIPPEGWMPAKGKRQGRAAGGRVARDSRTYAEAAAGPPPSDRRKRAAAERGGRQPPPSGTAPPRRQPTPPIRKPPKTAAVQVTCPPGQYADTLRMAREKVNIKGLGIKELRPRRARTGAMLLEVAGADGDAKADALARELREALSSKDGVVISRPTKTAEFRVKDIVESISTLEVAEAVADLGQCQEVDVRVGPIRMGTNRLGTAWVRCPLIAANRLRREGRLILAGWTRARVEFLPERPTTCFRCLRTGHVRAACPANEEDRGNCCYRCGAPGHLARDCTFPPKCLLCVEARRPSNHRVGSRACGAPKRANRKGGQREAVATNRMEIEDPLPPPRSEPMEIVEGDHDPPRPPLTAN